MELNRIYQGDWIMEVIIHLIIYLIVVGVAYFGGWYVGLKQKEREICLYVKSISENGNITIENNMHDLKENDRLIVWRKLPLGAEGSK